MAEPFTPFVEIESNPAPARLTGGSIALRNRKRLRYAIAEPAGYSRGTVLLLQGRNETIEKYFETISDLTAKAFTVVTFDWRGQGGSDRLVRNPAKGHVGSIEAYVEDLLTVLDEVVVAKCRRPYVVLGHSTGGLVALTAMPRIADRIDRIVLSAPFLGLPDAAGGRALPALSRLLTWTGYGRLAVRRTKGGARNSLEFNPLTSDPTRFARNRDLAQTAPHLFVPTITASWMYAMSRAMRRLDDSDVIAELQVPTLIVTAGADRVVRSDLAERLAWRMRSGHSLSLPGARHELLQERDIHRAPFLAAFEAFVGAMMPIPVEPPPLQLTEADLVIS